MVNLGDGRVAEVTLTDTGSLAVLKEHKSLLTFFSSYENSPHYDENSARDDEISPHGDNS